MIDYSKFNGLDNETVLRKFRERFTPMAATARKSKDQITLYLLSAADIATQNEDYHLACVLSILAQFRAMGKIPGDALATLLYSSSNNLLRDLEAKGLVQLVGPEDDL